MVSEKDDHPTCRQRHLVHLYVYVMSLVATSFFLFSFFLVDLAKTLLHRGWQHLHSNSASTTRFLGSGPLCSTLDGDPMSNPYLEVYVFKMYLLYTDNVIPLDSECNKHCLLVCHFRCYTLNTFFYENSVLTAARKCEINIFFWKNIILRLIIFLSFSCLKMFIGIFRRQIL